VLQNFNFRWHVITNQDLLFMQSVTMRTVLKEELLDKAYSHENSNENIAGQNLLSSLVIP